MPRKPVGDGPSRKRRPATRLDAWRLPPLPWILHAGRTGEAAPTPARIISCNLPEAFALAASFKEIEITLLESDENLAESARKLARRRRLAHLRVEYGAVDQEALGELIGGNYDLVLAHDSLHRASNAARALSNLAAAAGPQGTIYLGLRGSSHPGGRLGSSLAEFGLDFPNFDRDSEEALRIARVLAGVAGCLPNPPRDLVGEFQHAAGRPLREWLDLASAAGLSLRASTLTAQALPAALPGGGASFLVAFSMPRLCLLFDNLLQPPMHCLILSRQPLVEPPWRYPEELSSWRPVSRFLDLSKIAPLPPPLHEAASVEVEINGVLSPQNFTLSRYMLEVLRQSDGCTSLAELMARLPHETGTADLVPALHFLHHAFILELLAPGQT
jgi:SAM-dependent methyltransferase